MFVIPSKLGIHRNCEVLCGLDSVYDYIFSTTNSALSIIQCEKYLKGDRKPKCWNRWDQQKPRYKKWLMTRREKVNSHWDILGETFCHGYCHHQLTPLTLTVNAPGTMQSTLHLNLTGAQWGTDSEASPLICKWQTQIPFLIFGLQNMCSQSLYHSVSIVPFCFLCFIYTMYIFHLQFRSPHIDFHIVKLFLFPISQQLQDKKVVGGSLCLPAKKPCYPTKKLMDQESYSCFLTCTLEYHEF